MSKNDIKHNARINDNDFKIIEVLDKYIVAKPIDQSIPNISGAHICFNTGLHHWDNFNGQKPLYINQDYTNTGSIFIISGAYGIKISVEANDLILMPKKPISELNYSNEKGNLKLSANADGWVVALAKNKETIEEIKEKINEYIKKSPESDKKEEIK